MPKIHFQSPFFTIILGNLIPIFGVIFWGWTAFYVFWLFWIETLIVAIFNAIKIYKCKGDSTYSNSEKFRKALTYFLMRIGVFAFYSIFIIVFIGVSGSNDSNNSISFAKVISFQDTTFNLALVSFTINQFVLYMTQFYQNGWYLKALPTEYNAIFEGRQIIIHISVVLGAFIGNFLKVKMHNIMLTSIIVGIFCILKILYEIWQYRIEERKLAQLKN